MRTTAKSRSKTRIPLAFFGPPRYHVSECSGEIQTMLIRSILSILMICGFSLQATAKLNPSDPNLKPECKTSSTSFSGKRNELGVATNDGACTLAKRLKRRGLTTNHDGILVLAKLNPPTPITAILDKNQNTHPGTLTDNNKVGSTLRRGSTRPEASDSQNYQDQ